MAEASIIMPAYNARRTIMSAVHSVLNQSFTDLEIVVCDDASIDDTVGVLSAISDPRLRVIRNEVNSGPGFARDRAIAAANGRWLAFTDADDEWEENRLGKLLAVARQNADALVFDNIIECHDSDNHLVPWRVMRKPGSFRGQVTDWGIEVSLDSFLESARLLIKPVISAAFVKSIGVFHRSRPDSMEPVEDADYFIRILAAGARLCYVPDPMYHYRLTEGSATSRTDRLVMMNKVLEDAKLLFCEKPDVLEALERKSRAVGRDSMYMPFVWALKKRQLGAALKHFFRAPWVLGELGKRLPGTGWYQLHRWWSAGKGRGVR